MRSLHLLAIFPLLLSCSKDEPSDDAPETGDTVITNDSGPPGFLVDDSIELIRDDKGVPHIYANTRRGVYYGLGYASAQDRMFQMDFVRRKVGGTLTEFFWLDGEDDYNDALVDSDIMMRTLGMRQHAEGLMESMPKENSLELKAFADGVNAYLKTLTQMPQLYKMRGLGEIAPWTGADSILAWDHGWVFQGNPMGEIRGELRSWSDCSDPTAAAFSNCVPACEVPWDDASAVVPEEASVNWPDRRRASDLPIAQPVDGAPLKEMSHGWAISGDKITSGKPSLGFDPKIPLWVPSLFYPFHLSGPDLEVRGMGFPGAPALVSFWNEHLGQTITSAAGDMTDLFAMTQGSDVDHYMLDGVDVAYTSREETIQKGDGTTKTFTVKESVWGPVINEIPYLVNHDTGSGITISDILADRDTPLFSVKLVEHTQTETHSVIAAMKANMATSLESFREAHANWFTPFTHTIYAGVDKGEESGSGHIAYHHTSGIPWRATQEIGGVDYTGQHPQDGSDSSNDWTGLMTMDERPHVIDPSSGWIMAGNNLTVGSWYSDFAYSGTNAYPGETFRSLILRDLLEEMLAGDTVVTPEQVHLIHEVNHSYVADMMREVLTYSIDDLGLWGDPPASGQEVTRVGEKAHKVREALDAYAANGTGFIESNPYGNLPIAIAQCLKQQINSRSDWHCTWNKSTVGANWIARILGSDVQQAFADTPGLKGFVRDTAACVYDYSPPSGDIWQSDDLSAWTPNEPQSLDIAFGFFGTQCSVPVDVEKPSYEECSLTQDHVIHYDSIERRNKNLISSASDSSMPASVDFADVNSAKWLFPMGVSEDPTSVDFDSFRTEYESYSQSGPSATSYIQAPLDRGLINMRDITALEYWE
jgi:acyl-homoserine lactone acylase PvdQ